MFGNFGAPEILMILVVAALIFGAPRIPEIGANLGKGIKNFKNSIKEVEAETDPKKLEERGD